MLFENCTFASNQIDAEQNVAGFIEAHAYTSFDYTSLPDSALSLPNTEVGLIGCTFMDNTPAEFPTLLASNNRAGLDLPATLEAAFYSDSPSDYPDVCTREDESTTCTTSAPRALSVGDRFLNESSGWLLQVKEVRLHISAGVTPYRPLSSILC